MRIRACAARDGEVVSADRPGRLHPIPSSRWTSVLFQTRRRR
jgi:hypothetical protein